MRSRVCLTLLTLVTASTSAAAQVPTPESVLGFRPGADFKLATYEESIAYFQRLAATSDRIKLVQVGKTSLGRDWYLAFISSPGNLANLDRLRAIAQQLAHPADLTDSAARHLADEGRAFVDISGGLHASEVAGAQHTIQLAYDLVAAAQDPTIDAILDNVVLLLWPSLNPDGQDIVVNWYRENVGTPYEVAPLHELYQKYIGHDNNRDAYMLNVPESRVITHAWREWEPQVIYVHHQTSPFPTRIWVPPFAEPVASETPPLMLREVNAIGMTIAEQLEAHGQPGATHMGTGFDAWYPGYIDYLPMLQNIASWWTETALYRYATPHFYTLQDFPNDMREFRTQALYASPWRGGWWRLRDAVEYMETASLATLDYAAKHRTELLYNRYQAGRDAIERYRHEPPYAYLVPQDQRDPEAAVALLRRLAFNGVRIERLMRSASSEGVGYPSGTWVIPMDQEFAPLVRNVLEVQDYPDLREYPGGPPEQPYDAAGWTLPFMMDVHVVAVQAPLSSEFRGALEPIRGAPVAWGSAPDAPFATNATAAGITPPVGRVGGSGSNIAVSPAENNAFVAVNRTLAAGGSASWVNGRYALSGVSEARLQQWVSELALHAQRVPGGGTAVRSRVALYKPWRASMDEGWTRWLFDQFEFHYASISNSDLWAGGLHDRFDVIVLPSDSPRGLLEGYAPGSVPPRYAGGIGEAGVRALDAFVRAGGTLVCLNESSDFAIAQLHLPVKNVVGGLSRREFFASGSLLQVIADTTHPVMAGMPEQPAVFVDDSPVFTVLQGFDGVALAKYAEAGSPLLSGYVLGPQHVHGFAAALDVHHGNGHVILLGFRPQWRGQPWGTFRILFNAALYGGALSAHGGGASGFWSAPPGDSSGSSDR